MTEAFGPKAGAHEVLELRDLLFDVVKAITEVAHTSSNNAHLLAIKLASYVEALCDSTLEYLKRHLNDLPHLSIRRKHRRLAISFEGDFPEERSAQSASDLLPVYQWVFETLVPILDVSDLLSKGFSNEEEIAVFESLASRAAALQGEFNEYRIEELNDSDVNLPPSPKSSLQKRISRLEAQNSRYHNDLRIINEKYGSLDALFERADRATSEADAVRKQYEALNQKKSEDKLVSHFKSFHEKHNTISWLIMAIGLLLISATAVFAVYHALNLPIDADNSGDAGVFSLGNLAWKFTIVGGGTALSTYLLRLASYHRKLAVWSDTVQVQLQTFTPYTQQIGDEASKTRLRIDFARRVFGDEPGSVTSPQETPADLSAVTELSSLLANLSKLQSSDK